MGRLGWLIQKGVPFVLVNRLEPPLSPCRSSIWGNLSAPWAVRPRLLMGISVDIAEPRVMSRWGIGSPVRVAIISVVSQAEKGVVIVEKVVV